jgi:hypothetical protein
MTMPVKQRIHATELTNKEIADQYPILYDSVFIMIKFKMINNDNRC